MDIGYFILETSDLMDSFPIILAHRDRRFKARVAREIASSNGYCATKKLYYYGVKLHFVGKYKVGSLPLPVILGTTEASRGDIKVLEDIQPDIPENSRLFADKAYQTGNEPVANKDAFTLLTLVKKQKFKSPARSGRSRVWWFIFMVNWPQLSLSFNPIFALNWHLITIQHICDLQSPCASRSR